MKLPVLYSFRRCPFAMRARMALDAAGIAVEHREVLLRNKPADMLAASPKGTVPVLILPDGTVLEESLDIMIWALKHYDPEGWMVDVTSDRAEAEAFLLAFKDRLDRYKYASRYDASVRRGDVDTHQRTKAMSVLTEFTSPLSETRHLRSDHARLIDVASFPFVRQFAAVEPDWWAENASDALRQWLMHWTGSERFKRIMAKHPVWEPRSAATK
ncbi:MAG: glutathione S-transferase N-terminal domain-containing protein [Pseudomonadota bacterium]